MINKLPTILSLPANTRGRDFVVGDLRGAFNFLEQALSEVFFNPQADRLFSVGNVVGREPDSANCMDFFNRPYVHAVVGYNEASLINLYNLIGTDTPNYLICGEQIYKKGLNWWLDISPASKLSIISTLKALPIVIETETLSGLKVSIIHGEVAIGVDWGTFKAQLTASDQQTLTALLQGNSRIKSNDRKPVAGIDRIFAGHTTVLNRYDEGLMIYGNIIMTDTGAALSLGKQGTGLSIIDMDSLSNIIINETNVEH